MSTDDICKDTRCDPFTEIRESAQQRVQLWNCACELIPALRNIEGSPEQDGIALAIVSAHGIMFGQQQYLKISEKSTCKRCLSRIPLDKIMAALHSTKKNVACALMACRSQGGFDDGIGSSSGPSSLVTRRVSLLQPCGPGDVHTSYSFPEPTRELLLKTLGEYKSVTNAMEFLHGKFAYMRGKKVNKTPIEVTMHEEWMRHENNEDEVTPLNRLEMSPQEQLPALFTIYKGDGSHEEKCLALEQLRFLVAFHWDEITATNTREDSTTTSWKSKARFLDDILEALTNEKDGKLTEKLVQVAAEIAMYSIDPKTGFQKNGGIVRFIENSINGSFSLKMNALSILSIVPNLFGPNWKSAVSFIKTSLEDANVEIQLAAIKCLCHFLEEKDSVDLSPVCPILIQRAEERVLVADKDNEYYLFGVLAHLALNFSASFSPHSIIPIVKKGLQSTASERVKELVMSALVFLTQEDAGHCDWPSTVPHFMPNIREILQSCATSDSSDLKESALAIRRYFADALVSDPTSTAEFFKKLIEDSNDEIRGKALVAYYMATEEEDPMLKSALIFVIPAIVKSAEKYDSADWNLIWNLIFSKILNDFFSTNWIECSEIIGIHGLSAIFKQMTEVVTASCLTEEKAKKKERKKIRRARKQVVKVLTFLAVKDVTQSQVYQFINNSVVSTNSPLKRTALRIISKMNEESAKNLVNPVPIVIELILPLISTLNDEVPKVGAHAAKILSSIINVLPKEILLCHLNTLINATLEFAQKEFVRVVDTAYCGREESEEEEIDDCEEIGDAYCDSRYRKFPFLAHSFELLSVTLRAAEGSIAPFYERIITLLKNCPVKCLKSYDDEYAILAKNIFNFTFLFESSVDKGTFINDVGELLRRLVGCERGLLPEIARYCSIAGSDFAPLLPLVIGNIIRAASQVLRFPCGCTFGQQPYKAGIICIGKKYIPDSRREADATLTTMAKTLGELFAPHVYEVLKAVDERLKWPAYDEECWIGEIFPLLLSSIDSQGVDAKRALWIKFWPNFKEAVTEVNTNKFSAKAMNAISRSIEKMGSEGITTEESAEILQWIADEVDAVKKRREVESIRENMTIGEWMKFEDYKKNEPEAIEGVQELCKVGETILGSSFSCSVQLLAVMTGEAGGEESMLHMAKGFDSSHDQLITDDE